VLTHVVKYPQFDIRQWANGQRHARGDQLLHQFRVLNAAHAVIDA